MRPALRLARYIGQHGRGARPVDSFVQSVQSTSVKPNEKRALWGWGGDDKQTQKVPLETAVVDWPRLAIGQETPSSDFDWVPAAAPVGRIVVSQPDLLFFPSA